MTSMAIRCSVCHNALLVASLINVWSVHPQELQRVVDELLGGQVPSDQPLMEAGLDSIGRFISCITACKCSIQCAYRTQLH